MEIYTLYTIKNTVKAKYEKEDWLNIAGDLSDKIREKQKQALVSYLLMQPAIQAWGAEDADGLFEYLLIDVQMGACMDSSRIVQANSSVQMFVNRCLLNLESDMAGVFETGVSPGAIDRERWEWMKNYRVWEANRKVFLYPENWLEPEWRNDKSEFFKELESYLVQNDITERSVEQGLRNYLTSLNEVANLEVCGMHQENYDDGKYLTNPNEVANLEMPGIHQENYDDGKLKYLHVFGRTHNAPYKFYYRRWNEYRKWSPWEKVQLDIRSVEKGDNSGVHLIPVIWKKRLFLFWPEFLEVQEEPPGNSSKSVKEVSDDNIESLKPKKFWETRLAWSEYVDGKWSPKQVSKEYVKHIIGNVVSKESSFRFIANIDSENRLNIYPQFRFYNITIEGWLELLAFHLSDITSKIESGYEEEWQVNKWSGYELSFIHYSKESTLQLLDDEYLNYIVAHKLLLTPNRKNYIQTIEDPFFSAMPTGPTLYVPWVMSQ